MKHTKRKPAIVVISDTHFGCKLALCPPSVTLDEGGEYHASKLQVKIWQHWLAFWAFVDELIGSRDYILVHCGDICDNAHHKATTIITANMTDQELLAVECLRERVKRSVGYYQIRGTEAHSGQSADTEERVAATLGAIKDVETGRHSRQELWIEYGPELIHFAHHLGTTSSAAYESSAPMREIVAAFTEAGQYGNRPPSILVRGHRHRYIEVKPPCGRLVVVPGWQGRTPFVFKMDRMRAPMFGGIVIREGDYGVHIREKVWSVERAKPIKI